MQPSIDKSGVGEVSQDLSSLVSTDDEASRAIHPYRSARLQHAIGLVDGFGRILKKEGSIDMLEIDACPPPTTSRSSDAAGCHCGCPLKAPDSALGCDGVGSDEGCVAPAVSSAATCCVDGEACAVLGLATGPGKIDPSAKMRSPPAMSC